MTLLAASETPLGTSIAEADGRAASGRYGEALAIVRRALAAKPRDTALLSAQASIFFAWGRFHEAREAYKPITTQATASLKACLELGWLHGFVGHAGEAEAWMRKALAMEPNSAEAHYGFATALLRQGRLDEAIGVCAAASTRWPNDARFAFCLGHSHLRRGDLAGAESEFRRVVELEPDQVSAWASLGTSLRAKERHAEALEAFDRAIQIASRTGDPIDAFLEVATEYQLMGRNEIAAAVLEANLAQQPAAEGYRAYAEVLLALGRLKEGWNHYEARWLIEPLLSVRPGAGQPRWNGQNISGKTILLCVEQGFGDVIMGLRYAPFIKALGARVILSRFSELADGFPGVDYVIAAGAAPPPFDYFIPVMSLPRIFGTDLDSIPAEVPYLNVDPPRAELWRKRLAGQGAFSVGLAWAGRPSHPWDRFRSMAFAELRPLWDVIGVQFFSLQKGPAATLGAALSPVPPLIDLGPELADFADTAAVISQLDLVICVDTAVAHLAGALGKPVWMMISKPADWRWLEGREDTPWYPTMRLFRQRTPGDWPEVVTRVKEALQQRLQAGAADSTAFADRRANHVPLPAKPKLARLSPGHRPGFTAVAETRAGIVQYFPDEQIVGDSIAWYGEYLQLRLNLLGRLIRPGATVMEVGAGVGVHALQLAAATGPAGHLLLYEARPLQHRVLRQNLAANRVGNATLMKRALGAAGEAVDRLCETVDELQLEALHLLKINEDAAALEVLTGAGDSLWRLRPLLCIGVRGDGSLSELTTVAGNFGYRCWRMEMRLFNPDNFNGRSDDLFDGRTASALLAIAEEIEIDLPLEGCTEL